MKDKGTLTIVDPGKDKPLLTVGTAQCVHCGGHFPIRPGSGTVRGWCMNCHGPVCGKGCVKCVPTEQMLENIEKDIPIDHRPIISRTS